jgi:hypothetical protein
MVLRLEGNQFDFVFEPQTLPPIGNKFHPAEATGPQGQQGFMGKAAHSEQPRMRFWMRVE